MSKKLKSPLAVIPVAGPGTQAGSSGSNQPRALVPVAGKPILAHIVDSLVESGISRFVFIIGWFGGRIEPFIRSQYPGLEVSFVLQHESLGIAHAVWTARHEIKPDEELLLVLGDTIFDLDVNSILSIPNSSLGVKAVDDPRQFGVAVMDESGNISELHEKPKIPTSNLALVGIYRIIESGLLIQSIDQMIQKNQRTKNVFQLTDALMNMIKSGTLFTTFTVENWYDCGTRDNLLETNRLLLSRGKGVSKITETHELGIFYAPVAVAPGCKITRSILGPNVSVGVNAVIENSIVLNSIIGSDARIKNAILQNSVIGNGSIINGKGQTMDVGDHTELEVS